MKRGKDGKDVRDSTGQPNDPNAAKEIPALTFTMVEKAPDTFTLRLVANDNLIEELRQQGALERFLEDADQLYADFRRRFDKASGRPN
jgi:hypothetical protein